MCFHVKEEEYEFSLRQNRVCFFNPHFSPQNLTLKITGDSDHPGETEDCWKPSCPLIGPARRLICSQALTLCSGGGTAVWEVPETYGERLTCAVSERGLEGQVSLSLCRALLWCSLQAGTTFPVFSYSPTQPNVNLHWPGEVLSLHPIDYLGLCPTQCTNCEGIFMIGQPIPSPSSWQEGLSATINRLWLTCLQRHFWWQSTSHSLSFST